ncbi:hypothetical protein SAMN05421803_104109 [Nocardiopsis flavescens]|uniref:Uncharacterized protein n=1 Tax=Nocardiopsis flavescens TaxID=758803 RepID=A0A1M6HB10_9ACTN|nr:hypothetical protein SAMN05421803_104109 [Nocardiopsis flavescens]
MPPAKGGGRDKRPERRAHPCPPNAVGGGTCTVSGPQAQPVSVDPCPDSRGLTRAYSAPRTPGGEGRAYPLRSRHRGVSTLLVTPAPAGGCRSHPRPRGVRLRVPAPAAPLGVVHPPGAPSHSRRVSLPGRVARGRAARSRSARRRGFRGTLPRASPEGVRRTWRSPERSPVGKGGLWSRPTRTFGLQDGHRLERYRPAEPDPPPRCNGRQTTGQTRWMHVPGGGGVLSGGGSGRGLPRPAAWKGRKGPTGSAVAPDLAWNTNPRRSNPHQSTLPHHDAPRPHVCAALTPYGPGRGPPSPTPRWHGPSVPAASTPWSPAGGTTLPLWPSPPGGWTTLRGAASRYARASPPVSAEGGTPYRNPLESGW